MAFKLCKNICLIGPPGSGKGSYGRLLAEHWNVNLWTASDILRSSSGAVAASANLMNSGKLVDCQTVSKVLKRHLTNDSGSSYYILDGFPRTLQQIHYMESDWPIQNREHFALYLDVPDAVCQIKLLGRRCCGICGSNYNINAVRGEEGYFMPAHLPNSIDDDAACPHGDCDPERDWKKRQDDVPEIVQERLRAHRHHEQPIINYYQSKGQLIQVKPYHGFQDVPKIRRILEEFLIKREKL